MVLCLNFKLPKQKICVLCHIFFSGDVNICNVTFSSMKDENIKMSHATFFKD